MADALCWSVNLAYKSSAKYTNDLQRQVFLRRSLRNETWDAEERRQYERRHGVKEYFDEVDEELKEVRKSGDNEVYQRCVLESKPYTSLALGSNVSIGTFSVGFSRTLNDIRVVGVERCMGISSEATRLFGAEQYNYGFEMLHLYWLLSDRVADRELQDSILASWLVNLSGREGEWKPTDLALEHINASYTMDIKLHKNSTHNIHKTFGRNALASTYASVLRGRVEHTFGESTRSGHSQKRSEEGVFNLATHL